ncbi:hypothetical protein JCM14124_30760 [Humidesulfovibrio idahonensis]
MRYNKASEALPWVAIQCKLIAYIYGEVLFADTQSWFIVVRQQTGGSWRTTHKALQGAAASANIDSRFAGRKQEEATSLQWTASALTSTCESINDQNGQQLGSSMDQRQWQVGAMRGRAIGSVQPAGPDPIWRPKKRGVAPLSN